MKEYEMSLEKFKGLLQDYKKAVIQEDAQKDNSGPVASEEIAASIVATFVNLQTHIENLHAEAAHPCTTCKYEKIDVNEEPCNSCWYNGNWEEKLRTKYTFSVTYEYEWEPGVPISLVADKVLKEYVDQMKGSEDCLPLAELLRFSAAWGEITKREQQGHDH